MYGSMNPPLHVSGHASVEELKLVLNLVRPRYFMPIHGEYRQLSKHAYAGRASALRGPGGRLRARDRRDARDRPPRRAHAARRSRWAACASIPGPSDDVVEDIVIRDRRHLSEDGFVLPIIAINKHSGRSESLPEIVSRGFMSLEDGTDLLQEARGRWWPRRWKRQTRRRRTDWGVMQEKIRADLKRFLSKQTQRRPLIMPVILEV